MTRMSKSKFKLLYRYQYKPKCKRKPKLEHKPKLNRLVLKKELPSFNWKKYGIPF